ncbi:MAG: Arc family DNA-binding protein [Gemmatimonadetes bacterium]|nr:Arc family DNA-binding protein [Gemmatimonadota bacterium]
MANLTLKGIPDDLLERLRESAKSHRRSLNSEILVRLEGEEEEPRVNVEDLIAWTERFQERVKLPPLTDEFIEEAVNEGRP